MKFSIFFLFTMLNIVVSAQNETPKQYYDFIEENEIAVGVEIVKLSGMLKTADENELNAQLAKLRNMVATAIKAIDDADAYSKSKYLKEAAIDYFEAFKHLMKNDFKELIELISKDNIDANDKENVEEYYRKIKNHIEEADKNFVESKKKFTEKHQLTVQQNPFKFYLNETKQ
jgi:hypothetical protein